MHKIDQSIQDKKFERLALEAKAYQLSLAIQAKLGWKTIPQEFEAYPLPDFHIVKTKRLFANGWIDLLEINPKDIETEMGYSNTGNAPWITLEGTATVNCPPDSVLKQFFKQLDSEISN